MALKNSNKGLVQLIIIILLSVIILSLLGVSLRALVMDQTLKENLVFLWDFIKYAWGEYVWPYLELIWEKIDVVKE